MVQKDRVPPCEIRWLCQGSYATLPSCLCASILAWESIAKRQLYLCHSCLKVVCHLWNKVQNSNSDSPGLISSDCCPLSKFTSHATSSIHCAPGTVFALIQTCQLHDDFRTFMVFPPEGPEKLAQLSFPGVFDNCLVHMIRIVARLYLFSTPEPLLLTTLELIHMPMVVIFYITNGTMRFSKK